MLPGAESIREPQTSEIIGVLDVTGDNRLVRPHLVTVLIERGLEIEERLALERCGARWGAKPVCSAVKCVISRAYS